MEDVAAFRRRLFREKRAQLEGLLEVPLLLFWGTGEGPNIRALTLADDFSRPMFVLCRPGGDTVAFVQQIETDAWAALAEDVDVIPYGSNDDLKGELSARLEECETVAVEASGAFFSLDRLPPSYFEFVTSRTKVREGDSVLVPFRALKSPAELILLKKASEAAGAVFEEVEIMVRPGVAEAEILNFLLHEAVEAGGAPAFFPIVASGARSQHPHPRRRSGKIIEAGDRVIVDYGVDVWGYKSDITRTYVAGGDPSDDPYYDLSAELATLVREADLRKLTPLDLGKRAAQVVREAGLSDRERHGYGHGLGVETHDPHPYIAATLLPWLDRPFEDGMVFTFEPGFYDERGGFRREDDFVVGEGRAIPLPEFESPA